MTLHLSAITNGGVYQVSDRLASRNAKPWDPTWNKTVVLRTADALVAIGLTGSAFVGDRPINHWVAEILFGGEIEPGVITSWRPDRPSRRGLSRCLAALVEAFGDAVKTGALDSQVLAGANVIGRRVQGGRVRVCHFALKWDRQRRPHFLRRTRTIHRYAGAGSNPRWVDDSRLAALCADLRKARSDDEREDLVIGVLREVADEHVIGSDAMSVRIGGPHPVPAYPVRACGHPA